MRILIVEDEITVSRLLEMHLERSGCKTYSTTLGEEAIDLASVYEYDLVLLDLNLPDMNGSTVLRALRKKRIETPVLVLTGDSCADQRLECFGLGADDFLQKPFHRDELLARIRAIVRRANGHASSTIRIGRLSINLDQQNVFADDLALSLTGREFQFLELLALRKGATVTKEAFLNHVYGGMDEPEPKIIDVYICRIRKKIEELIGPGAYIETVWGRGYTMGGISPESDRAAA